jgi:hypothetical protein
MDTEALQKSFNTIVAALDLATQRGAFESIGQAFEVGNAVLHMKQELPSLANAASMSADLQSRIAALEEEYKAEKGVTLEAVKEGE